MDEKWIDVEKVLPPEGAAVVIWSEATGGLCWFATFREGYFLDPCSGKPLRAITHWMRKPGAPKSIVAPISEERANRTLHRFGTTRTD